MLELHYPRHDRTFAWHQGRASASMCAVPVDYSDEVLLSALEHARGDDRSVLVSALARSRGGEASARLRHMVDPDSGEQGVTREAALWALARREGAAETLVYARALRDRSVYVQSAASQALAEYGDAPATAEMLAWMRRKLRRKNRVASLDYEEVRAPLRFATRNGVLREVARILVESWDRLDQEERRWLAQAWPALRTAASSLEGDIDRPDDNMLSEPIPEDHRGEMTPEFDAELSQMEDQYVAEALARAQRRAQRQPMPRPN